MKNIKIEEVSDLNMAYNYLEIFVNNNILPFLEVSINENKELVFTYLNTKDKRIEFAAAVRKRLDFVHHFVKEEIRIQKEEKNE